MAVRPHAGKWGYFDDFDVDLPEKNAVTIGKSRFINSLDGPAVMLPNAICKNGLKEKGSHFWLRKNVSVLFPVEMVSSGKFW